MGKARVNRGNNFIARCNQDTWTILQALKRITRYKSDEAILQYMAVQASQIVANRLQHIEDVAKGETEQLTKEGEIADGAKDTNKG